MPERPTSRRQFLQGQSAAEALTSSAEFSGDEPKSGRRAALLTLTRRAMACDFQVRLNATARQNETAAAMAALDMVEQIEDRLTVYRDRSELIVLNRAAAAGPVEVAEDLFELLLLADRLHAASGGAFDITGGPLSAAWGFSRREGRMPSEEQLAAALERTGWDAVNLNDVSCTVEFTRPGIELNLNSLGKGFALDRAADVMTEHAVDDFLLHGGRSTLLAHGNQADGVQDNSEAGGWGVGIRHPLRPRQRIAEVRLRDAAFSTSGSATQSFVIGGRRLGHLIDPRTAWPAEGLHSVSVVAPTGAEADALSTAFYVMGYEAAAGYCRSRVEVQAIFVLPGPGKDEVEVRHENLDPACWRLAEGV